MNLKGIDLKGRSFLTLKDYSKEEILYMIDLAAQLKAKKKRGEVGHLLEGKNIVLIFDKTSTRTRCSLRSQPSTRELMQRSSQTPKWARRSP